MLNSPHWQWTDNVVGNSEWPLFQSVQGLEISLLSCVVEQPPLLDREAMTNACGEQLLAKVHKAQPPTIYLAVFPSPLENYNLLNKVQGIWSGRDFLKRHFSGFEQLTMNLEHEHTLANHAVFKIDVSAVQNAVELMRLEHGKAWILLHSEERDFAHLPVPNGPWNRSRSHA